MPHVVDVCPICNFVDKAKEEEASSAGFRQLMSSYQQKEALMMDIDQRISSLSTQPSPRGSSTSPSARGPVRDPSGTSSLVTPRRGRQLPTSSQGSPPGKFFLFKSSQLCGEKYGHSVLCQDTSCHLLSTFIVWATACANDHMEVHSLSQWIKWDLEVQSRINRCHFIYQPLAQTSFFLGGEHDVRLHLQSSNYRQQLTKQSGELADIMCVLGLSSAYVDLEKWLMLDFYEFSFPCMSCSLRSFSVHIFH